MQDNIKQSQWALEKDKIEYLKELLQESDSKLKQRNKLIKIADSSEAGWETVRQYEANPIASDSEDENKIFKAESRAVPKRKNALKTKFPRPASSTVTRGASVNGAMSLNSTSPRPSLQYPANMPSFIPSF